MHIPRDILRSAVVVLLTSTTALSQTPQNDAAAAASATSKPPLVDAVGNVVALPLAEKDLWQRVRRGFVMDEMSSPLVQNQELWYANRPDYIERFVERGARYLYHIVEEVERRGLPTEIVLLPIIESAFNPQAYSRAHASGMWQFIPSTGKNFGLKQDWMTDNRRDVLLSTNAALDYLTKLYGMFNSWELAFAAYNCGEGCVGRAIAANQRRGLPTDFASLKLPNETRSYVPKLIAVKNIVLSPGSYGIELPVVDNRPFFTQVAAPEKIDVKLAARLAEMEPEAFAQLNPSFNKPVAATGTGYFLVPTENADTFRLNLELYQSLNGPLVSWVTVSAKRGESVDAVARKHGMTASYLRATNGPFKERKGVFSQPVTFMAPNAKDASAISAAIEQKVILKREQQNGIATDGNDGALTTVASNSPAATPVRPTTPVVSAVVAPVVQPLATANPSVDTAAGIAAAANSDDFIEYRVRHGETLFSIAKRANWSLTALKTQNQLTSNVVGVGKVLQVPAAAANSFSEAEHAPNSPLADASQTSGSRTSSRQPVVTTYVVRAGDTLFAIARKFQTSVDSLLRINRLTVNSILQPGMRIKLAA